MLKKLLVAGAVGASIFGIAAASASALPQAAQNGTVVQQSDNLSATCTANNGHTNDPSVQFQSVVKDTYLAAVRVYEQDVKTCSGDYAQAVATLKDGTKAYSDIVRLDGGGLDTYLLFPTQPLAGTTTGNSVQSVQLTIAGWISNTDSHSQYVGAYGAAIPSQYHQQP